MPVKKNVQDIMFSEIRDKKIFRQAQSFAYDYLETIFERNVFPTREAINNLRHFDESMPSGQSNASDVINLLNYYGSRATVAQLGGRYFGLVCGSAIPVGLAAKNLATYWDQNTAMYVLSPLASKLESVTEGWLKQLFNLPEGTVAGFVGGTSSANLCGLAAGRYRILKDAGWDPNEKGLFNAPQIKVVAGRQAHSAIMKALAILGFGKDYIQWVDSDDQGRMIPERMPELDNRTIVILQAGNVNSGCFDPFSAICEKAIKVNAWVHIDGAIGLWAAAVNDLKYLTNGIEMANSWAVDGHKTLNTPYESGIVLCKDKEAIVSALHMSSSYIILSETERDGMFYTPDMSRRARVVELWATLKYLGREGIDQMIYGMHERAVQFANDLSEINGFKVVNYVVFNQVLVQCETDDITERTIDQIQKFRDCWVGGSTWKGRKVIRISVSSWATTAEDISRSVKSFEKALNSVLVDMLEK